MSVCVAAEAAPIIVTNSYSPTLNGENFNLALAPVAASSGPATLILRAQGDYSDFSSSADETLTFDIEGLFSGGPVGGFNSSLVGIGGPFDSVIEFVSDRNVLFQRTYTIPAAVFAAIAADGVANFSVDLGSSVNALEAPRFVEFTLQYDTAAAEVPEPASIALWSMMSVAGLAAWRRRKRATV